MRPVALLPLLAGLVNLATPRPVDVFKDIPLSKLHIPDSPYGVTAGIITNEPGEQRQHSLVIDDIAKYLEAFPKGVPIAIYLDLIYDDDKYVHNPGDGQPGIGVGVPGRDGPDVPYDPRRGSPPRPPGGGIALPPPALPLPTSRVQHVDDRPHMSLGQPMISTNPWGITTRVDYPPRVITSTTYTMLPRPTSIGWQADEDERIMDRYRRDEDEEERRKRLLLGLGIPGGLAGLIGVEEGLRRVLPGLKFPWSRTAPVDAPTIPEINPPPINPIPEVPVPGVPPVDNGPDHQFHQEEARREVARREEAHQEEARRELARQESVHRELARQEEAHQEEARRELVHQESVLRELARRGLARREDPPHAGNPPSIPVPPVSPPVSPPDSPPVSPPDTPPGAPPHPPFSPPSPPYTPPFTPPDSPISPPGTPPGAPPHPPFSPPSPPYTPPFTPPDSPISPPGTPPGAPPHPPFSPPSPPYTPPFTPPDSPIPPPSSPGRGLPSIPELPEPPSPPRSPPNAPPTRPNPPVAHPPVPPGPPGSNGDQVERNQEEEIRRRTEELRRKAEEVIRREQLKKHLEQEKEQKRRQQEGIEDRPGKGKGSRRTAEEERRRKRLEEQQREELERWNRERDWERRSKEAPRRKEFEEKQRKELEKWRKQKELKDRQREARERWEHRRQFGEGQGNNNRGTPYQRPTEDERGESSRDGTRRGGRGQGSGQGGQDHDGQAHDGEAHDGQAHDGQGQGSNDESSKGGQSQVSNEETNRWNPCLPWGIHPEDGTAPPSATDGQHLQCLQGLAEEALIALAIGIKTDRPAKPPRGFDEETTQAVWSLIQMGANSGAYGRWRETLQTGPLWPAETSSKLNDQGYRQQWKQELKARIRDMDAHVEEAWSKDGGSLMDVVIEREILRSEVDMLNYRYPDEPRYVPLSASFSISARL
ncbi:hypothetical protein VMCG_00874 [Cytospora schulzeri]|uniref:Uncharacterized protein n=1 Tax=Cytospora schulzeri TaxID=448051 RepID=A0A423X4Q0_9PEZI|nr:hypothetical protein VMCG_00874 [Valsa malicola]